MMDPAGKHRTPLPVSVHASFEKSATPFARVSARFGQKVILSPLQRARMCSGLPMPAGSTTFPLRPEAATMQVANRPFNYDIGYYLPGSATANGTAFVESVNRLGLVFVPYSSEDTRIISGWLVDGDVTTDHPMFDQEGTGADEDQPSLKIHQGIDVKRSFEGPPIDAIYASDDRQWSRIGLGESFPIYVPADGIVESISWSDSAGNIVVLRHTSPAGGRFWSIFGHVRNGLLHDAQAMSEIDADSETSRFHGDYLDLTRAQAHMLAGRAIVAELMKPDIPSVIAPDSTLGQFALTWGRPSDFLRVRVGQRVGVGQLLGFAGCTGVHAGATTIGEEDSAILVPPYLRGNIHLHYLFAVSGALRSPAGALASLVVAIVPFGIDPYGLYQRIDQTPPAVGGAVGRQPQYGLLGPIAEANQLLMGSIPIEQRILAARYGIRRNEVLLVQHDPIYSASRVQATFRPGVGRLAFPSAPDGGVGGSLFNDLRLVGGADAVHRPFRSRPLGAVRFCATGDGVLSGVFRAWDEATRRVELEFVAFAAAALERSTGTSVPFACGTRGERIFAQSYRFCSDPDIAARSAGSSDRTATELIVCCAGLMPGPGAVDTGQAWVVVLERGGRAGDTWAVASNLVRHPATGVIGAAQCAAEHPLCRVVHDGASGRWLMAWTDSNGNLRFASRRPDEALWTLMIVEGQRFRSGGISGINIPVPPDPMFVRRPLAFDLASRGAGQVDSILFCGLGELGGAIFCGFGLGGDGQFRVGGGLLGVDTGRLIGPQIPDGMAPGSTRGIARNDLMLDGITVEWYPDKVGTPGFAVLVHLTSGTLRCWLRRTALRRWDEVESLEVGSMRDLVPSVGLPIWTQRVGAARVLRAALCMVAR